MTGKCEFLTIVINRGNFLLLPHSPGPEAHGLMLAWSVAVTFCQEPAQRSLQLWGWLRHSNISLRSLSILWLTGEEIFLTHSFREQEFQKAWWDIAAHIWVLGKEACTEGVPPPLFFTPQCWTGAAQNQFPVQPKWILSGNILTDTPRDIL